MKCRLLHAIRLVERDDPRIAVGGNRKRHIDIFSIPLNRQDEIGLSASSNSQFVNPIGEKATGSRTGSLLTATMTSPFPVIAPDSS